MHLNLWGAGLSDVSLVSQMPKLQIASLSVNKITTLQPFASCTALRELYLRKNLARARLPPRHMRSKLGCHSTRRHD